MFRKLQDRVVAAASSALGMNTTKATNDTTAGSFPSETIQRLQALGDYSREQVESALQTTNGNMDQAAELLFTQAPSQPSNINNNIVPCSQPQRITIRITHQYSMKTWSYNRHYNNHWQWCSNHHHHH